MALPCSAFDTVLAIRDGGARIAIELIDQPAVREWMKSLETIEPATMEKVTQPVRENEA